MVANTSLRLSWTSWTGKSCIGRTKALRTATQVGGYLPHGIGHVTEAEALAVQDGVTRSNRGDRREIGRRIFFHNIVKLSGTANCFEWARALRAVVRKGVWDVIMGVNVSSWTLP
jgi:hypothetical protein